MVPVIWCGISAPISGTCVMDIIGSTITALVSLSPVDGADTGHSVAGTDAVRQQTISYFPRKHRLVFMLVLGDVVNDAARRHLRLRASNDAWLD